MAQAMASMFGLRGSSSAVMEGSLQISGAGRLTTGGTTSKVACAKHGFRVRAQQNTDAETSRRAVLGLVAAGIASGSLVQGALAGALSIKVGPPPPPSGGLPGTLNSDEARDLKLPLKERFYLQPLTPTEAAQRAKESAKEIVKVKALIDQKAWPYVRDDLRLRAGYLRYDLNTIISAKSKDEKKALKDLTGELFQTIDNLDYAAKIKNTPQAEKYYSETVATLNDVLSKLG
ncbi:hypothetical protein Leryth_009736 [Lithospermum erythrorhizon]|uniref:16 kDa subunit of oxygen evolving system of photosystem II n=1 Tax=Lithospermum erythrorhizon TaxID=34254 RepID=A0AAV3QE92_LITER|nr:hypothetical protein Leryth_009736 [Lithospermum erythrorhizon]